MRRWGCLFLVLGCWLAVSGAGAGQVGPTAAQLVRALSGEDAVARLLAEERLIEMGDDALAALEPAAGTGGPSSARPYAIHILARIASPKAVGVLLGILERESDVMVRGLICEHLGRLGVEEAVPVIGKWLFTIRGKTFGQLRHPVVLKPAYGWMRHAHALREIGDERGIAILEEMLKAGHKGAGAQGVLRTYRESLLELKREAAFHRAVKRVPGLEPRVNVLFGFFRTDTLARIRLHRMKLVALGTEGRWVLGDLERHPDKRIRDAAAAVLSAYDRLHRAKGATK